MQVPAHRNPGPRPAPFRGALRGGGPPRPRPGELLPDSEPRYKLRIRTYHDSPEQPVFFEIKRRNNQVIQKQRCRARRADVVRLLTTGATSVEHMPPAERKVFDEFTHRVHHIAARPAVMVRYEREAWCGVFDPTVRVTFDRQICCRSPDGPRIEFNSVGWDLVEGRRVILEFKFNGRCPAWMASAIRNFGLQRVSYSKYSHALLTARRAGPLLADA
ncbi:MAG: VTC domain-containing protein [Planctomycetota bacterium]